MLVPARVRMRPSVCGFPPRNLHQREQDLELRLAELTAAHERLQREMRELGEVASKTQVELAGKDDHHRAYVETSELQYKRLEEKYALVQGTLVRAHHHIYGGFSPFEADVGVWCYRQRRLS